MRIVWGWREVRAFFQERERRFDGGFLLLNIEKGRRVCKRDDDGS